MRVLVAGGGVREILIETMLEGLYAQYGDNLFISYPGDDEVSKFTAEWAKLTWPVKPYKHCFDGEWSLKFEWGDFLEEASPEVAFFFGEEDPFFNKDAVESGIPVFSLKRAI